MLLFFVACGLATSSKDPLVQKPTRKLKGGCGAGKTQGVLGVFSNSSTGSGSAKARWKPPALRLTWCPTTPSSTFAPTAAEHKMPGPQPGRLADFDLVMGVPGSVTLDGAVLGVLGICCAWSCGGCIWEQMFVSCTQHGRRHQRLPANPTQAMTECTSVCLFSAGDWGGRFFQLSGIGMERNQKRIGCQPRL